MEQRLTDSLARRRLSMLLLATFAIAALTLAAVGVYGTIAYWVSQRRREIGIRMALGATRTTILGLIAQEFGRTVGVGLVAGLLVAFALTRVMSSLLFGVNATDATTFSLVPLLMALIAAAKRSTSPCAQSHARSSHRRLCAPSSLGRPSVLEEGYDGAAPEALHNGHS